MPDIEAPALPAAGPLTGAEIVHVVQSGNSRRETVDGLRPKVSVDDTTPGYLEDKVTGGDGIIADTTAPAGDEKRRLALAPHYLALASSALYEGATLSAGPSVGRFSVAAGEALVIDSTTGAWPTISVTELMIAAKSDVALTNILTQPVTYISIDSGDNIVQRSTLPTPAQMRDEVFLGVVVHSNNVDVNAINNIPSVGVDAVAQLGDLMRGLGFFNLSGNVISANGANLSLAKSAGTAFRAGVNYAVNEKDPHTATTPVLPLVTFRYRDQLSVEGADVTVLDPANYDNGGVPTTVPANNNATIQRVFIFPSGAIRIQPGQEVFANLSDAIDALGKEPFLTESNLEENGLLLASIAVIKVATDLTNTSHAQIFLASRFGDLGSVGSSATTSLQQAYTNSTDPEVTTADVGGAIQLRRGTTGGDADVVLEVQDGAGAAQFSVAGDGTIVAPGLPFVTGTRRPLASDDDTSGYRTGTVWIDTTHRNSYLCIDATTGAAVWEAMHVENIHYQRLPTSGDHWDGPAAEFLGSNDFIFAAWIRAEDIETYDGFSSTFSIVGNQTGTTGWRIAWNFGGVQVIVYDGSGVPFGPSNFGTTVGWGWNEGGDKESDVLVVGRVTGGAGTAELKIYLNGRRATTTGFTATNTGITASTTVLEMGGRGLYMHEGFAYLDGTATDAELQTFMEACIKAGGIVDGGITWDSLFNSQDPPVAGNWNDQVGVADLTDTGAPAEVSRRRRMVVLNTQ